jgi:hypothetical protein
VHFDALLTLYLVQIKSMTFKSLLVFSQRIFQIVFYK